MSREKPGKVAISVPRTSELSHLLMIPDGNRRYARRSYLADLFRKSKKDFRTALEEFSARIFLLLEKRIEKYVQTGNDPFYKKGSGDLLDSSKILVPQNYLLNSYRKGGEVLTSLIKWILQNNITNILSIYALQRKNLERTDEQLYSVLKSEAEFFKIFANDIEIASQCKFKFVGDKRLFNQHRDRDSLGVVIKKYLNNSKELEKKSSGTKLKIYILAPYDRNWEINQAVINGRFDSNRLVVKEEVDLIIRAGYHGRTPTSGALPYQTAYAQFSPVREYFEDLSIKRFQKTLREYRRKRESGV